MYCQRFFCMFFSVERPRNLCQEDFNVGLQPNSLPTTSNNDGHVLLLVFLFVLTHFSKNIFLGCSSYNELDDFSRDFVFPYDSHENPLTLMGFGGPLLLGRSLENM